MNEETIKEILSKDLKEIPSHDFNEKIIQQLNQPKKKERLILFDQKAIVTIFLISFLFVSGIQLNLFKQFAKTNPILGFLICMSPLFYMVFNKIYQSTIQKTQNHEKLI